MLDTVPNVLNLLSQTNKHNNIKGAPHLTLVDAPGLITKLSTPQDLSVASMNISKTVIGAIHFLTEAIPKRLSTASICTSLKLSPAWIAARTQFSARETFPLRIHRTEAPP